MTSNATVPLPASLVKEATSVYQQTKNSTLLLLGWFFKKDKDHHDSAAENSGPIYARNAEMADHASAPYIRLSLVGKILTIILSLTLLAVLLLVGYKQQNGNIGIFNLVTTPNLISTLCWIEIPLLVCLFIIGILMYINSPGKEVVELAKKWRSVRKKMTKTFLIYEIRNCVFPDISNDGKIKFTIDTIRGQEGRGWERQIFEGFSKALANLAVAAVDAESRSDFKESNRLKKTIRLIHEIFTVHFSSHRFAKLPNPMRFLKHEEGKMKTALTSSK